jgi:HSP20 family molecular chaperone IbpA
MIRAMTNRNSQYWMWAEACELLDRAERLHRQFFLPAAQVAGEASWEPPVDMFETDGALWLIVALPGVAAERIEISFGSGGLLVAGVRAWPAEARGAAIRRLELPAGRFERVIELPPGRFELVERRFVDGCLSLGLRKLTQPTTRTWMRT